MEIYIYAIGLTIVSCVLGFIALRGHRKNLNHYDLRVTRQINKSQAPLWIKNFYLGLNQAILERRNFLCDVKGHDIKEWKALYQGLRFHHKLEIGDIDIISSDPAQEIMVVKTTNIFFPLELRLGDPRDLDREYKEVCEKFGLEDVSYKPSLDEDYENVIQVDFSKKRRAS